MRAVRAVTSFYIVKLEVIGIVSCDIQLELETLNAMSVVCSMLGPVDSSESADTASCMPKGCVCLSNYCER